MITGNTKLLGVMGHPIKHSFSPAIHNAALTEAGLDYAYLPLEVPAESLENTLRWIRTLNFRGFNVTIPHKNKILSLLDEVTEEAKRVGAVNTVIRENGRLIGYNTDIVGFIAGLKEAGFDAKNKNAVILGAGGAARAVISGLIRENVENIEIIARNVHKAVTLAQDFNSFKNIACHNFESEEYKTAQENADIIINTTPLGMNPNTDAMPPVDFSLVKKGTLIYDVIYTPEETKLLKEAKANNLKTINGETMLVEQGAAAFRLWTGEEPNVNLMKQTLKNALSGCAYDAVE